MRVNAEVKVEVKVEVKGEGVRRTPLERIRMRMSEGPKDFLGELLWRG
jgi:hypothetical protein